MTDSERKRIFGLARELGMNRDELHALVFGITSVESIARLDNRQTYAVIKELENRMHMADGVASKRKKQRKPQKEEPVVPGMITPNQKKYCWSMLYRLCELEPREAAAGERMCGAIVKILGVTAVPEDPFKWVNFEQGRDLIEGLKRYVYSAELKAIREGRLK